MNPRNANTAVSTRQAGLPSAPGLLLTTEPALSPPHPSGCGVRRGDALHFRTASASFWHPLVPVASTGCACSPPFPLSAWIHLLLAQGSFVRSPSAGLAAAVDLSFANIQATCLWRAQPGLRPGSVAGPWELSILSQSGFAGTRQ